jgi:hypothetical protein
MKRPADSVSQEKGASEMHGSGNGSHTHEIRAKLDPKAFGLACGLFWGGGLFALTWWIMAFDGPSRRRTSIGRFYRGYTLTPLGSLMGLAWAFADGLTGGACFAWLYNRIAGHRRCG